MLAGHTSLAPLSASGTFFAMRQLLVASVLFCGTSLVACQGIDKDAVYQVEESATVSLTITGMT
jgi:hypothetical protein